MSLNSKMCDYDSVPSPPSCMFAESRHIKQEDMSLWAKTQQLQGDAMRQVQNIYGVHFPIEVRHFFSQWLEQQQWDQLDENNPAHEQYANQLLHALIKLIEEKAHELTSEDMFVIRMKLIETGSQFGEMYGRNALNLVRVLKKCLATERHLVQQVENPNMAAGDYKRLEEMDHTRQINIELDAIHRMTQQTEAELRQLQHKQEQFIIQYQENVRISSQIAQLQQQQTNSQKTEAEAHLRQQKQSVETQLQLKAQELRQGRQKLAERHQDTISRLNTLQTEILDKELIDWKRKQQLYGSGSALESTLETLQQWCEALAELIWQNRQQIKKVEFLRVQLPIDVPPNTVDLVPQLNTTITGMLSSLVTSTFIIERQPPQVLKKEARFPATVRLLVGGKLNVHMNPPQVTASIISEYQARALLKSEKSNLKSESSGEILNNKGTMEYHSATGQLSVSYRNMQLKKIKRADRKGTEAVTEEKFSILFQSQFNVGGGELVFQVWTLSLPVVVTVHGNQEGNAMATVLWDNYFSEPGRLPFAVPDAVMWPQLKDMLNSKFKQSVGRGLNEQSLDYLAQKLFGSVGDASAQRVTWAQFNKETMKDKSLTFWEWFYGVLKLTKEHLREHWVAGTIHGFVSKQDAQSMLLSKPDGTFLLRFSDNTPGGITIAWVAPDSEKPGDRLVWNLAPYTSKDFTIRSLADRIKDLEALINLYPDISKATAFGKYWTLDEERRQAPDPKGYVQHELIAFVPSMKSHHAAPMDLHNPQTPMGMMPQSPQSSYQDGPASVQSQDYSTNSYGTDGDTGDGMNPIGFEMITDYVPEDIDTINVNELLLNYPN